MRARASSSSAALPCTAAEIDNVCFQNTLIRFRASEDVDPGFALLVFRHYFRSGQFQRIARWSTNIAHLGLKRFSSMPFPLPPLSEQRSIAHRSEYPLIVTCQTAGAMVSSLIDRANSLRQSLLAEAFAGQTGLSAAGGGHWARRHLPMPRTPKTLLSKSQKRIRQQPSETTYTDYKNAQTTTSSNSR